MPCSLRGRLRSNSAELHAQRARFSSLLHHETLYDMGRCRNGCCQRGATNLQKSYKSLLYTCTLSDSQSGISRNFPSDLRKSFPPYSIQAIRYGNPTLSRRISVKILRENGKREKLGKEMPRGLETYFVTSSHGRRPIRYFSPEN